MRCGGFSARAGSCRPEEATGDARRTLATTQQDCSAQAARQGVGRQWRRAGAGAETNVGGQHTPVTVSIGGSGLPDKNATNSQDLILVADAAMYTSKESGRDRCVVA